MLKQLKSLEKDVTERMDMLKNMPDSGLVLTDPETGETVTAYKPTKISNSSYRVTLANK
jgi:hypothetical protein